MGHRALVAYERPDGRYDVHYSHWGAAGLALQREIAPATPFADRKRNGWTPRVDPTPRARAVPFDDVPDHVDPREFEALYVVTLAWVVAAYLPLWFGPALDSDVDAGALVAVDSPADARRVRRWVRATRAVVRDVAARGALSEREAVDYLTARIDEWTGDRREVIHVG